jgi:putative endonuclease
MAKHNIVGKEGEQLALKWCKENGFTIQATNWRYKRFEVDIIASKDNVLHVIEVKTRTNTKFGLPEEGVTVKKIENMLEAAAAYTEENTWKIFQFDIISILLKPNTVAEITYLPDVYL